MFLPISRSKLCIYKLLSLTSMRVLSIRTLNGKDQDNLVFLHDFHRSFHFIVPYNHDHCKQRPKIIQLHSKLNKKKKKRGRQS